MIVGLFTLLLVATVTTRRWIWVTLTVLGPALTIALTELVGKPLTDRGRDGHLLYPSGHMTAIVAMITVTYILLTTGKPARYHVLTGLTWLATIFVAATGLIGNREHFFTDPLGGMLGSHRRRPGHCNSPGRLGESSRNCALTAPPCSDQ